MNERHEDAGIERLRQVVDEVAQGLPAVTPLALPPEKGSRWLRLAVAALLLLSVSAGGWWMVAKGPLSVRGNGSWTERNVEVLSMKVQGREVRPRVIASQESGALVVTVERPNRQRAAQAQPLGYLGGQP